MLYLAPSILAVICQGSQRCYLFQVCVIFLTDALPGANYIGRSMLGSLRFRMFQLCVICRRITSMFQLAPNVLAVLVRHRLFQLCVFCLRQKLLFGLVPSVLPDVIFCSAFFDGVIHRCIPSAYPRSRRLGEVAERLTMPRKLWAGTLTDRAAFY